MDIHPPFPLPTPSAEQSHQLEAYADMLLQWNKTHNLIGASTTHQVLSRHLQDSLQLVPHLPTTPASILDVGSGAGLPGMVLAILCPQHAVTLAERLSKKCAFLRTCKHRLKLDNVTVFEGDCKALPSRTYDVVTARAVAPLSELLPLTETLLKNVPEAYWLLLKGKAYQEELDAYNGRDKLTISIVQSIVEPSGVILRLHPAR